MLAINTAFNSETQYHSALFTLPPLPKLNTITEEETWELLVEDLTDLTLVTSSPTTKDSSSMSVFVKPQSTLAPPRSTIKSPISTTATALNSKAKTKKFSSKLNLSPYYRPSRAINTQKHFIN
jgi:hypothetical protein